MDCEEIFALIALVGLSYMLLVSLINALTKKLINVTISHSGPKVSVLVPARNEEENIETCLRSLCSQNYGNYEVLVMDDNSSDETFCLATKVATQNPEKVKVFHIDELPMHWYGKPHAMHQLYLQSTGDIFLLTDADTVHGPDSVSYAVSSLSYHKCDFVTGFPRQIIQSFGEILTVPLIYGVKTYLPFFLVKYSSLSCFKFAVGQYICITREAMEAVDGMKLVKAQLCEDLYLAHYVKERGFKMAVIPASKLVACRMYRSLSEAFDGLSKAILPALSYSLLAVVVLLAFLLLLVLFPLSRALYCLARGDQLELAIVLCIIIFTGVWALALIDEGVSPPIILLYPFHIANVVLMTIYSVWVSKCTSDGFTWKGRHVR